MSQQGWVGDGGETGQVDQPGEEQIIEIGIDAGQGAGGDSGTDQGAIDIQASSWVNSKP
ncbi:hypothetical protein [Synechococcus sp. GFB01]|uniref:hypothetical protein n=1 Tax=Synechococcus sp. GFB01 TaxID=1662190 RepID=UPI0013791EB4|nr:hypothetical protein [Synechococcus sp. GFB01]